MTVILLAGLVVFATHALEAVTGFGCTVLALPFITALFGLKSGVMTLTILAWLLALYIAISKRRDIDWRQFAVIVGFVIIGLPSGMYLFRHVDAKPLKKLLAAFIVLASSLQIAGHFSPKASGLMLPKPLAYCLLFAGGIVHGIFSSGGPLVVLYASGALPDKGKFRATLCLLWTTLNSILIGGYLVSASIDRTTLLRTAAMLPFLAAGIVAGDFIHQRVASRLFNLIVFGTLFFTGVIMLAF
ncbi:sulfite exporter TauE/SafE family protein [bacterium]|nr:sulfite exporter TauE/SafE family protein [bacterium]